MYFTVDSFTGAKIDIPGHKGPVIQQQRQATMNEVAPDKNADLSVRTLSANADEPQ